MKTITIPLLSRKQERDSIENYPPSLGHCQNLLASEFEKTFVAAHTLREKADGLYTSSFFTITMCYKLNCFNPTILCDVLNFKIR